MTTDGENRTEPCPWCGAEFHHTDTLSSFDPKYASTHWQCGSWRAIWGSSEVQQRQSEDCRVRQLEQQNKVLLDALVTIRDASVAGLFKSKEEHLAGVLTAISNTGSPAIAFVKKGNEKKS